jgi:hypothetical protein
MAFGSSWRNRDAAHEEANQESRKAGIIVEAFDSLVPAKLACRLPVCVAGARRSTVPNARRLAETPYSFRCGLADYS